MHCGDLASRPSPSKRGPACLPTLEVEGNVDRMLKDSSYPIAFPQLLEGSCSFPAFSIWFLFLVGCLNGVHLALSCLVGITVVYTYIPLSLLMGRVSSCSLAQLPSWASPWCFLIRFQILLIFLYWVLDIFVFL